MKPSSLFPFLTALLIVINMSCNNKDSITGADEYYLTSQEVKTLEEAAKTETNGQAAYRLSTYYGFSENDQVNKMKWLIQAANQGHPDAKERLEYLNRSDSKSN